MSVPVLHNYYKLHFGQIPEHIQQQSSICPPMASLKPLRRKYSLTTPPSASFCSHLDYRIAADLLFSLPSIRACLFDMDGLLLDTEDKYTQCVNTLLAKYGRPPLPWSIKAQLQGRPFPQSQEIFHKWAQLPIAQEQYALEVAELQRELFPSSQPLPGVVELLANLNSAKVHTHHALMPLCSHKATNHFLRSRARTRRSTSPSPPPPTAPTSS